MLLRHLVLCGAVLASAVTAVTAPASGDDKIPEAPREFRGVWVSSVNNGDWPSSNALTPERQRAELIAILDKAVSLNLNAILLQVRPACDALYDSKLEPWSDFLTGQMGKAPEPYYDPLEFAVAEAHKRGLELHAWINPYRAHAPASKSPIASNHISKTHPEVVKSFGGYMWLDPGEKVVQDHSIAVVVDMVKRYDIDGVHMDDYFYPYREYLKNEANKDFPDDPSWKKYQATGGKLSRDDWRRSNVDQFVERLYAEIKATKKWVKFGISPFGIWKSGYPPVVRGMSQYDVLYADARKWWNEGWCDYLTPQLYWKLSAPQQPYVELVKWWAGENKKEHNFWPGNSISSVDGNSTSSSTVDEVVNQVKATREQKGATGNVFFSMRKFMREPKLCEALKSNVYSHQALVPPSKWLDGEVPGKPVVSLKSDASGGKSVNWKAGDGARPWLWVLYTKAGGQWLYAVLPGTVTSYPLGNGNQPDAILVSAVDRCGNESERGSAAKMSSGADTDEVEPD